MQQTDLFLSPVAINANHEKYLAWRKGNADVFRLIRNMAVKMMERGRRFSIDAVVHHVRFNEVFEGYRDKPYRISNSHVAYIARELVEEFPRMADLITLRTVAGEDQEG